MGDKAVKTKLIKLLNDPTPCKHDDCTNCEFYETKEGCYDFLTESMANYLIENGVTIPVRCRYCDFHRWEQEPCHGKTEHFCSVLNAQVFPDFYCYHGKLKEVKE